jgi:hypothetical protein
VKHAPSPSRRIRRFAESKIVFQRSTSNVLFPPLAFIDVGFYNVFAEPQFSVADDGSEQPEWQIFLGFNM